VARLARRICCRTVSPAAAPSHTRCRSNRSRSVHSHYPCSGPRQYGFTAGQQCPSYRCAISDAKFSDPHMSTCSIPVRSSGSAAVYSETCADYVRGALNGNTTFAFGDGSTADADIGNNIASSANRATQLRRWATTTPPSNNSGNTAIAIGNGTVAFAGISNRKTAPRLVAGSSAH
jgi:hypothetical protein